MSKTLEKNQTEKQMISEARISGADIAPVVMEGKTTN